jgi:hypothetical protein
MKALTFPLAITALTGVALAFSRSSSGDNKVPDETKPIKTGTAPSGTKGRVAPDEEVWLQVLKGSDVYDVPRPPSGLLAQHKIASLPAGHRLNLVSTSGAWVLVFVPAAGTQPAFEGWMNMSDLGLLPAIRVYAQDTPGGLSQKPTPKTPIKLPG